MSHNGQLPYYYLDEHTWEEYCERLTQFFLLNNYDDDKKKELLIQSMSWEINKRILRKSGDETAFKNETFHEIIELLTNIFGSGTNCGTTMYRSRLVFYSAQQIETESVADWLERIKILFKFCQFGCDYEDVILDKFISGIRSLAILDVLLKQEYPMDLDKIVEIALREEDKLSCL